MVLIYNQNAVEFVIKWLQDPLRINVAMHYAIPSAFMVHTAEKDDLATAFDNGCICAASRQMSGKSHGR